jgi:hypothetical protein
MFGMVNLSLEEDFEGVTFEDFKDTPLELILIDWYKFIVKMVFVFICDCKLKAE